jgi:hypothetical protein
MQTTLSRLLEDQGCWSLDHTILLISSDNIVRRGIQLLYVSTSKSSIG